MFKKQSIPKKVTIILLISVLISQSQLSIADPLLLSDAEMQKLKMYFPNDASADGKPSDHVPSLKATPEGDAVEQNSTTRLNEDVGMTQVRSMSDGDTYVALTRYAWQQLYAPTRLLNNPLGISRAPMQTDNFQSSLVYGDKVIAHPLASWSLNHWYITAVSLRNQYPHATNIRLPYDICGNWAAAVLYPRVKLSAAGNKTSDSTTLFILSRNPFNKAMEVCHVGS